ncbi:hypothetical protein NQ176_g3476 [Zarea fungicola]|uniref:Uncharacterized protein n=1 Tax=Zarea fungicola TaxID=93591 RepID=A0ACC1NKC7_9HYPO|nr:hypothetical protein NQ176_g3476 [Lecanicillium fungicola]
MAITPLFFLKGKGPSRRSNWNQATLAVPDSLNRTFEIRFEWRRGLFVNIQSYPPHDEKQHDKETLYHPPPHYHIFADEYFHVSHGAGTWHLWDRDVRLETGDEIIIPARTWHWFEGDHSTDDPLSIEVYYDKGQAEMEERFFRNVLNYLADCNRESIEPSIFQLLIFFYYFEMAPGLRFTRWESLNFALNLCIMSFGTVVGILMGYQKSYTEYYQSQKKAQ